MNYKKLFYGMPLMVIFLLLHQSIVNSQIEAFDSEPNLPPTLEGNRALTLNETGYVFYTLTPIAEKFLTEEASPQKHLLEIGSGFSNVAIEAFKRGVGSYTANDISKEHLDILVLRIRHELRQNAERALQSLKLMPAEAPAQLPLPEGRYDAILIDKVLHFMTPSEIDRFLTWSRKALKDGGKIYIVTSSPTNAGFSDKLLALYLEKSAKGDIYAGYFENVTPYLSEKFLRQNTEKLSKQPNRTTFFNRDDLKKILEHHGFKVQETYALRFDGDGKGNYSWPCVKDEESDAVGAIAIKNKIKAVVINFDGSSSASTLYKK